MQNVIMDIIEAQRQTGDYSVSIANPYSIGDRYFRYLAGLRYDVL